MPVIDYFDIIVSEICAKQNGLALKTGDHGYLRQQFEGRGGNIERLVNGVLPEFDTLKSCIIEAYHARRIATAAARIETVAMDVPQIMQQFRRGREAALRMAQDSLGETVLRALVEGD